MVPRGPFARKNSRRPALLVARTPAPVVVVAVLLAVAAAELGADEAADAADAAMGEAADEAEAAAAAVADRLRPLLRRKCRSAPCRVAPTR